MRTLFSLNNPVMRFLSHVFDVLILNILLIVCSIPIITMGTSIISCFKVLQDMIYDNHTGAIRSFFKNFKLNFKQGILCSLLIIVYAVIIGACFLWLYMTNTADSSMLPKIISAFIYVFSTGFLARLFAMIARYENTFKQHLYNSFVLTIINFLKTIAIALLMAIPLLVYVFAAYFFLKIFPFWFSVFPCLAIYCINRILKPTFRSIDRDCAQDVQPAEEKSDTPS